MAALAISSACVFQKATSSSGEGNPDGGGAGRRSPEDVDDIVHRRGREGGSER